MILFYGTCSACRQHLYWLICFVCLYLEINYIVRELWKLSLHRRKKDNGKRCRKRRFFTENLVSLQPNDIAYSIFFTLLIEIRSCKATIAAKQELDGWIIIQVFVQNRLQEIGYIGTGISRSITELDFYQITSDSVITNERMVAITRIMDVQCQACLRTL